MPHVVFLRAANVGGNNVFRPTQLVAALKHLDVVNIGAAGTFVVRAKATRAEIKKAILEHMPFAPTIMIRPGKEVLELVESNPFRGVTFTKDMRGWVGACDAVSKLTPALPIHAPDGDQWAVRFSALTGAFALGLWRRQPGGFRFPADLIEKHVGMPSTVRWYETFEKIAKVLAKP